ncbi:aegerolysin family protein [Kitasatospora sp. CM 4170]|uniref:Aegerolysin family protein n=1 Tax=Kitasatospora aburaviensis TaxID=67265 RepID=A0ABW1EVV2_9ACTN|nr:aegerolysin family protein [Kitasatospora sp. CM 4170]WNM45162.1 aegerolysin family protein [Kitasatospora sp. CM 4170]
MSSTNRRRAVAVTLATAAALTAGLAGTASAAPATADGANGTARVQATAIAARSTVVYLNNWTGCTLTRESWELSHGIWTLLPPVRIYDQKQGFWSSESNGFATGTEGFAQFYSENCANPLLNGRLVRVHWNNPYVGSNSYDWAGSDLKFHLSKAGGSGNNAVVEFSAWGS